jgi:hypothetical protein
MPAKKAKHARSHKHKTATAKRLLHTFYLVQPLLQFVAIVVMVLAFTRCSPLAPSTMKEAPQLAKTESPNAEAASQRAEELAKEELIQKSFIEVDQAPLTVTSEEDISELTKNVPHWESPADESTIRGIFEKRKNPIAQKRPKVLLLPLNEEMRNTFFHNGTLRIDVTEKLRLVEKAKRTLLKNLAKSVENKEVGASLHLVMSNATMQRVNGAYGELAIDVKVSLGQPQEDKLYLYLEKQAEAPAHAQDNAVLLESALEEALGFVILLE